MPESPESEDDVIMDLGRANLKLLPKDPSLLRHNPFNNGQYIGCYAIIGEKGEIELVPPTRDVAAFWRCMMGKGPPCPRPKMPKSGKSEEVRRRSISEELSADEWSPTQHPNEEKAHQPPREPHREAHEEPQQEPQSYKSRTPRSPKSRSPRSQQESQPKASGNDDFNPCDTMQTLSASDLAALCEIPEHDALEAIRAVNHRGDDQLDCVDFEVLKEYIKAKNNRKRQKSRTPSVNAPRDEPILHQQPSRSYQSHYSPSSRSQKTRSPRSQPVSQPVSQPSRSPRYQSPAQARSPKQAPARTHTPVRSHVQSPKQINQSPNDNDVPGPADPNGEAVILHGRGQMYHVDVILGDVNVQIGNAQLAYDQITAVHSSKNCCLAIMTKRGRILLQCSSKEVRDHWKSLLEARSEPASRDD